MRAVVASAAFGVTLGASFDASAAQIYGRLNQPAGVLVRVQCDNGASGETRTDAQGSYQVFIAQTGRCTLSLPERSGAQGTVYSYDEPARFDFDVVDGSQQLRAR